MKEIISKYTKRLLIKIAYAILQYYSLETMPYIYCTGNEYEVISVDLHPGHNGEKGWVIIKAICQSKE